jgi:hypothetical protein
MTLITGISPGKAQNLSSRAVWLYLMRLDDLWALLLPASLPPASGLIASSLVYGREFATRFFQLHLTATPCVSLRLPSSAPIGSFHPIRFCPCWAHWRTHSCVPRRHSCRRLLLTLASTIGEHTASITNITPLECSAPRKLSDIGL